MSKKKQVVRDIYRVGFYVLIAAWVVWMVALLVDLLPDIIDGILNDPVPFYFVLGLLIAFAVYQIGVWAFSPDRPEYKPEDDDDAS